MATNTSLNISHPQIPIFKGDSYEFWSIKMTMLFKSQELWEYVETGYEENGENEAHNKEHRKKDAKALFFIQQAVDDSIFPRIAAATRANQAWATLKTEFQGSSKVITVKLQSLRRDFETSFMKHNESVQDFLARVSSVVGQMKAYGEKISDDIVVAKVLRSLPSKFDHVVAAIEESKDLSTFSFDELMGSLQAHEARINRSNMHGEERAFQTRGESESSNQHVRGRGRGSYRGRGRGRNTTIKCLICNKPGHSNNYCWYKPEEGVNYAEQEEDNFLFMAIATMKEEKNEIWYLDSGCSNHMTGDRSKFKDLNESIKSQVRLGDNKQLQIEGKGITEVLTGNQKRCIKDVHLLILAHNSIECRLELVRRTKHHPYSQVENEDEESILEQEMSKEDVTEMPNYVHSPHISTPNTSIEGEDTIAPLALFAGDPVTVEEAMEIEEWRLAMKEELSSIEKNQTWELTDLPEAFLNGDLKEEVYVTQPPGFESKTKMGKLQYFLGLEVIRGQEGIIISQRKYVDDTLKKFNMQGCKTVATPMNISEKLMTEDDTELTDAKVYRSLVGRLLYVTHSRPDVAYSVGVLSRFMHRPTMHHFGAARRVLRSKKQATVALSSTEAEYVAACASACQAVWLRGILSDLGQQQSRATSIKCDNQSAVFKSTSE
ncbi:retrovirus-related pol polyprotein from transposon TNT 1-94 [Tanacetum coccineum]